MMSAVPEAAARWQEANHRHLASCVTELRQLLDALLDAPEAYTRPTALFRGLPVRPPPALEALTSTFGLSEFGRGLLLLAAAAELDSGVAERIAACRGQRDALHPTASLALRLLPGGSWTDLSPAAPLRRWDLLRIDTRHSLAYGELRVSERILFALQGLPWDDVGVRRLLTPVAPPDLVPPSHQALVDELHDHWARGRGDVVVLHGEDREGMVAIACGAAAYLDHLVVRLRARDLPTSGPELDAMAREWGREARLAPDLLVLDAFDLGESPDRWDGVERFAAGAAAPLVLLDREPRDIPRLRPLRRLVRTPRREEQRTLWQQALGPAAEPPLLDRLADTFDLPVEEILHCASTAGSPERIWSTCVEQQRAHFSGLATRHTGRATWEDLVLPELLLDVLHQLAAQLRYRSQVLDRWQLGDDGDRGRGIAALFSGPSGTGKTLAARVVAHELGLDLYQVDLSRLVSKYIGETESNLRRVFDAAERSGAVLLFDEADAVFGRRSEVRDSHDRYANVGVSYLLQRMESFRGLAVLTTNMRDAIDTAFSRRFRFILEFPFPDRDARLELWRRMIPEALPSAGLDLERLAQLNLSGAQIRNVLLNAAFFAAADGVPVDMGSLRRAARIEAEKQRRPLTPAELRGWPSTT